MIKDYVPAVNVAVGRTENCHVAEDCRVDENSWWPDPNFGRSIKTIARLMAGVSATGEHNGVTRFVINMAGGCFLAGVTLLLAVILVPSGESRFRTTQPTLVEFGIFVAGDSTCFFKRIFKGQKSPVVFSLQSVSLVISEDFLALMNVIKLTAIISN